MLCFIEVSVRVRTDARVSISSVAHALYQSLGARDTCSVAKSRCTRLHQLGPCPPGAPRSGLHPLPPMAASPNPSHPSRCPPSLHPPRTSRRLPHGPGGGRLATARSVTVPAATPSPGRAGGPAKARSRTSAIHRPRRAARIRLWRKRIRSSRARPSQRGQPDRLRAAGALPARRRRGRGAGKAAGSAAAAATAAVSAGGQLHSRLRQCRHRHPGPKRAAHMKAPNATTQTD